MSRIERIFQIALFCGLLGVTMASKGQTQTYPLTFGFYGGITASQVTGDTYQGFQRIGVNAGLFLNQYVVGDIYWQVELKYVTRDELLYQPLESPLPCFSSWIRARHTWR